MAAACLPWARLSEALKSGDISNGDALFQGARLVARSVIDPKLQGWDGEVVAATCRLPLTFFPSGDHLVFSDKVCYRSLLEEATRLRAPISFVGLSPQFFRHTVAPPPIGSPVRGGRGETLCRLLALACSQRGRRMADARRAETSPGGARYPCWARVLCGTGFGLCAVRGGCSTALSMPSTTPHPNHEWHRECASTLEQNASVWSGAGRTRTPLHVDMVHALVFQVMVQNRRWPQRASTRARCAGKHRLCSIIAFIGLSLFIWQGDWHEALAACL